MKKFKSIAVVLSVLATAVFMYKYVLFDHEPFDDLKAGEIESIYLTRKDDDWRVTVTDISGFVDAIEELELHRRTNEPRESDVIIGVKVNIYYYDGTVQIVSVDNCHIQIDDKLYDAEHEEAFYFMEYANQLIFDDNQLKEYYDKTRYDTVIGLYMQGMSESQVRQWVKEQLLSGVIDENWLRTLANSGWAPEQIYVITDEKREQLIADIKESVMPGGSVRRLIYEEMASEVLQKYKDGQIVYDEIYSKPPENVVFPDFIDWSKYSFAQDEMGYFYVIFPSADEKYNIAVSVDDMMFDDVMRETPLIRHVDFYKI
ncbi:MAG: hypothetical protein IKU54_02960 [Oscillospiraceae bacterium]|nr:hypothetical protein [Oscillospiraceae bacterium]